MSDTMDVDPASSSDLSDVDESRAASAVPSSIARAASLDNDASSNFRRRSTRVVKKPTAYIADPVATQPGRRAGKRKRAQENSDDENESGDDDASSGTAQNDEGAEGEEGGDENGDAEDEEEEEEEEEEEDEVDPESESEGEPDEEELKERRKKQKKTAPKQKKGPKPPKPVKEKAPRKPATKRVKTATGAQDAEVVPKAPAMKKKKQPAPRRSKVRLETNGDGPHMVNELYDSVFENSDDHDEVANKWITQYQENQAAAMKEMVNFILKCCGCNHEVTNFDIEDQDSAATTLSGIAEQFQNQPNADYPLMSKKPVFRKFRANLNSFFSSLISAMHDKDLFINDVSILETIQIWITTMSSSTLRQFRHTSTVISLDMVSHLAEIAADIRKNMGTTNRQIEAEEKKTPKNDARIRQLKEKAEESEQRKKAVEDNITDLFDTVFVHRYRDIDAKIRSDCIHELGNWILTLPDVFFDGSYLRYLGWVLSDSTASTRLEVVKALTKLFKRKNSVSGLRHFTEKFRERLVEMGTQDSDSAVRTATVELLDVVREVGYLEPSDISTVGRLLFDGDQRVRKAVVPFFIENINDLYQEKVEELGGEEAVLEALGDEDDDHEGPTASWIKLKSLVEAIVAYDREDSEANEDGDSPRPLAERTPLIVGKLGEIVSRYQLSTAVLWDALDEMRDWEGIAKYLLFDHSASRADEDEDAEAGDMEAKVKKVVALSSREEVILLHILHTSVFGCIVKASTMQKNKTGQAVRPTAKEVEKQKEDISRSLMQVIPPLLKKFGPVPDAASCVLRLATSMDLNVFSDLRQIPAWSSLLDEINRQFLTHSDECVLKDSSDVYMYAKTFSDLAETTEAKLDGLKESVILTLTDAVRGKDIKTANFSEKRLTDLVAAVKRLEYLSAITNNTDLLEIPSAPGAPTPISILLDFLARYPISHDLEEDLIVRSLKSISLYFMWKIQAIRASGEPPSDPEIDEIIDRHTEIMSRLHDILDKLPEGGASGPVEMAVAGSLLDLTTLFVVATDHERLNALSATLPEEDQKHLMTILDAAEKHYGKITGHDVVLPIDAPPEDDDDEDMLDMEDADKAVVEQRLCEYAAKLVVAVIARIVDLKLWRKRLARNQQGLGHNYKEVINHLDRSLAGRPGTRRGPQKVAVLEKVNEEEEHDDIEEHHDDEEHEEDHEDDAHKRDEIEEDDDRREEDRESEPDPEAPILDDDGDEEMADA